MAWMASIRSSASRSTITSSRFPAEFGADHQHPRWIVIGVEVDGHQFVLDRVQDVVLADAVLAGRSMNLHQWSS